MVSSVKGHTMFFTYRFRTCVTVGESLSKTSNTILAIQLVLFMFKTKTLTSWLRL